LKRADEDGDGAPSSEVSDCGEVGDAEPLAEIRIRSDVGTTETHLGSEFGRSRLESRFDRRSNAATRSSSVAGDMARLLRET
jgi:hypothetical protein